MVPRVLSAAVARRAWTLVGLLGLAFALRALAGLLVEVISKDGTVYATNGAHLAAGRFSEGLASFFPPGYPIFIALASFVAPSPEAAGKVVSLLLGTLGLLPLYLLTRRLAGSAAALAACLAYAVHPAAVRYGGEVLSEATYITLLLTGCVAALAAVLEARRPAALLLGGVAAAAYLVRPEGLGLVVMGVLGALLPWGGRRRAAMPRRLAAASCVLISFLVVAGPYLLYLRSLSGGWTLSQKLGATVAVGLMKQRGSSGALLHERAATLMQREEIRGFNTARFVLRNLPLFLKKAASDIVVLLRYFLEALYAPFVLLAALGVLAQWRASPSRGDAVRTAGAAAPGGAAEAALLSVPWRERNASLFMLLLLAFYLLAFSFLLTHRRYMVPLAMLALPWAGRGWIAARDWLARRAWLQRRGAALPWAAAIMAGFVIASSLPAALHLRREEKVVLKEAGRWLRAQPLPPGSVMTNMPRIAFYAGRPSLRLPLASYGEVVQAARAAGARLLVVDTAEQAMRETEFAAAAAAKLPLLRHFPRPSPEHPQRAILIFLLE
ncbi:MAG: glycosyltransferase family 39 protein [Candidatus Tectomicrobia bacterium]|nr:glycosyltransferase family 39 protein [Candidatus Tectomicrobia bacterium]